MFRKNRLLVLLLVVLLVSTFTFTACSNQGEEPVDSSGENVEQQQEDVVATAATNYFANMTDNNMIKADEFIEKVKAGLEDAVILDIRAAEDYEEGHIKGAVNLPYGTAISDNLEKLPNDKEIFVYCYSGQTASQTIALLNVAGFNATNVASGWKNAITQVEGYEEVVETTANELPEATTEVAAEIKQAISDYYSAGTNHKISPEDVKKALDEKDESIFILDIRAAEDFEEGHIEGAVNIPYGKGMQEQFNTLPEDKTIVVVCYSGQTADQTNAILNLLGYDSLGMSGGMNNGWLKAEYPVVTE